MLQKMKKLQMATRIILLLAFSIPFIVIFVPFTKAILMAVFFAFAVDPLLKKIGSRTKTKKYFATGLLLFMFVFMFIPSLIFIVRIVNALKAVSAESMQDSQFFKALFDLWEGAQNYGLKLVENFGLDATNFIPNKEELFSKVSPFFIENIKLFLSSLPDFGLSLFVFCSMLVLFTTRAGMIKKAFIDSHILPAEEINHIIRSLKSNCYLIAVSILIIGALQAFIVAVGSLIFGYHEFFLIFAVTFLLSFIPVIGAAPVAVLLAIISFINKDIGHGIGMSVIAVVAGTIDNILKPYIFASDSENLHPLVSLFGIIGAIVVFGISGLILGPFIMQITMELGPYLIQKLQSPAPNDEIDKT